VEPLCIVALDNSNNVVADDGWLHVVVRAGGAGVVDGDASGGGACVGPSRRTVDTCSGATSLERDTLIVGMDVTRASTLRFRDGTVNEIRSLFGEA